MPAEWCFRECACLWRHDTSESESVCGSECLQDGLWRNDASESESVCGGMMLQRVCLSMEEWRLRE